MKSIRLIGILLLGFVIGCGGPISPEPVGKSGKGDGPDVDACLDLDYHLSSCFEEYPYGECIEAPVFDFAVYTSCCQSKSAAMTTCGICEAEGIDDLTRAACCKVGTYDYCQPVVPPPTTQCEELDINLSGCTSEDPYLECIGLPGMNFDEHVGCCQSFGATLTSCSVLDQHCQIEGLDDATRMGCCKVGTYDYCQPVIPTPTMQCEELDIDLSGCTSEDPYLECIGLPGMDFDEHVGCCQSFGAVLTSCDALDQHCQAEGIDDATKTGCCKVGTYTYCQP